LPNRRKWQAAIQYKLDGKHICKFLGRFADELEAARAYNRAAKLIFGKFALTNEKI
jgi:hypothetical protein